MFRGLVAALAGIVMVSAAQAEPLDAKAARKALFAPKGLVMQPVPVDGLSEETAASIDALVEQFADRTRLKQLEAAGYGYYGALAVPTDRALQMQNLAFVAKLHSPEAARKAALAACAKASRSRACAVVGVLLPKRFEPRPLTLSQVATQSFRKEWKAGAGPKALATSAASDAWVMAKGPGAGEAALERCNAKAGAQGRADCSIVIAED